MRVFVSAGEASGDAYGAAIVSSLKSRVPDLRVEAMGGEALRREGATLIADSSNNSAIGVMRSLGIAHRVIQAFRKVRRALRTGQPGLFIPIDYGAVNIRLSKYAKSLGWRVLYFIPPGSWRKDRQGADLPFITDAIVTPFPWSAEMLRKMGANTHWYGHPIKSLCGSNLDTAGEGIAILPGSRMQEVQHNIPAIAEAVQGLGPVEFAVATTIGSDKLRKLWLKWAPDRTFDRFTENDITGVLQRARMAVVCSGTATLQAAVAHCPMVVIYRFSKVMAIEARLLGLQRKLRFISLPNIYLDRPAVPELVAHHASPEAIRSWIDTLSRDSEERRAQLSAFDELDVVLGPSDCIERTADLIVQLGLGV